MATRESAPVMRWSSTLVITSPAPSPALSAVEPEVTSRTTAPAASQSPYGGGESQSGSIGLGFAIPIDEVMPIVDQMASGETPTHARLGIQVGDAQTGDAAGAVVRGVTSGSTAEKAGLGSGSVITKVDDHRITGADSLVATIRSYRPGDSVSVTWTSGGKEQSADLVLDSDATQG